MGDYTTAQRYFEQALALDRNTLGEKHANVALSLNNLGFLHEVMGDSKAALSYYQQALAIDQEIFAGQHPDISTIEMNRSALLAAAPDPMASSSR